MNLNITIPRKKIDQIVTFFKGVEWERVLVYLAIVLSIGSTLFFLKKDLILAYGDAESHLNIAKRIIHGLTPGFAQMGGVWLPLTHFMMIPFVYFDPLWRSGLAGSIVSGFSYVISAIVLYKLTKFLTYNSFASFLTALVFMLNPNILYLQSTAMTELPLIMFFLLSSYFFVKFIRNERKISSLLLAATFGFCAVFSRYDGWFLVLFEALTIIILDVSKREKWEKIEGKFLLFSTLAFFGIVLWMIWDFLILGDPFYFVNSQFSARTQQLNWLHRGELPAYQNLPLSFAYYLVTAMSNSGLIIFLVAIVGLVLFLSDKKNMNRYFIGFILLVPIIFNTFTLFMGQSVIFIPHLTPVGFEWRLFNVRYGVIAIPLICFLFGYAYYKCKTIGPKLLIIVLFILQFGLYAIGYSKVISLADGVEGLSMAKRPDAETFIQKNYDYGLILLDDYARTMSIIRSGIPMQSVIYVGNKPYWQESLVAPERYARWIIMQKDDDVWKAINDKPEARGRLYKYFEKVYTSPNILIFRKIT